MRKSKIEKRPPEPQQSKEQKPIGLPSSPAFAKPNVICSQSKVESPFIKHRSVGATIINNNFKPYLNLEDAKLDLGFKAQTLDLKSWILFIVECSQNVKGFYEWFDETYKRKDFSIVVKVGTGFYIDSSQMRVLYSSMSSKPNLFIPPSKSKTTDT